MASSVSGSKRPADDGSSEDGGAANVRLARQPRLEVDLPVHVNASEQQLNTSTGTCSTSSMIGIEVICDIASFMNPDDSLLNLCVSVGRADAARIRAEYLRDNETYVASSLRQLWDSTNTPYNLRVFVSLGNNRHSFDKCRDNISAWMQVNPDWRNRCTDENNERYKGVPVRMEANLVFNNPAVAIEVGLLEVLRFLVEERNIDVNRRLWSSYNTKLGINVPLIRLALVCGDKDILEYLLSVDGFDLTNHDEWAIDVVKFSASKHVNEECFKAFIQHPKVNVNATGQFGETALWHLLENAGQWNGCLGLRAQRIVALLEAGANPRDGGLIDFARMVLGERPENPHWRLVVEKMEEKIAAMEQE
eukprot:CAMPEP_0178589008 /NCGR_PEP_ID=MMETSP0697-20121206/27369_1 /TAXON_ID=265572 /ORGANISM="Extubocellulus spinifer, Strain CCMP396" /LENGTH=362 /DNA_ID=CAMNT_0020225459 /DNA_START=16 /DNA_END=1104 /DNA_ORIENTATION=-